MDGRRLLAVVSCAGLLVAACTGGGGGGSGPAHRIAAPPLDPGAPGEPVRSAKVLEVVATTSVVADWLRVLGATNVRTHVAVKAGLAPVSYLVTPGDVDAIRRADLVVGFGRGLEPWLDGARTSAAGHATFLQLSDGLPDRATPAGVADPFTWLDPTSAERMVAALAAGLTALDPPDGPAYAVARDRYQERLVQADADAHRLLGPVAGRPLITAKETFGWLAARYGLDLVGAVIPSIDPRADSSPQHLTELLVAAAAKGVKAVFAESTVPEGPVAAVAHDAGAEAVLGADALHGDGLGLAGSGADTYLGAFSHDVKELAAHL